MGTDAISSIFNMVCNMVRFYIKLNTRLIQLTHWGQVMHICVSEFPIIGSDNGLSIPMILSTQTLIKLAKFIHFHSRKYIWKCCMENGVHFVKLRAEYRSAFELTKDMHLIIHPWLCDFYDEYLRETAWEYGQFSVPGTYMSITWATWYCIQLRNVEKGHWSNSLIAKR